MTASSKYELLEAEGDYFDGSSAKPIQVIAKFGDASLTLMDGAGTILAHWPLASMRRLPGSEGHEDGIRLIPDHQADERLTIRDPDMIKAIREVCPDLDAAPKVERRHVSRVVIWLGAAVGSILLIVFVLAPAIAGRLAEMIPPESEAALGERVADQLVGVFGNFGARDPVCKGPEGLAALDEMTVRLTKVSNSHVPIRVRVLDTSIINAVALPGGQIFLFRGLIDQSESPEEVAGVLAHEIGHVIHRDPTREALRAAGTAGLIGLLLGDVTGGGAIAAVSEAMINAGYTREAEAAADAEAHRILASAGLPSTPFGDFFEWVSEQMDDQNETLKALMEHMASHPDPAARKAEAIAADTIGDGDFKPALDRTKWAALRDICDE